MVSKTITIELKSGLEPRPAAVFVQVASQYDSTIFVEYANKKVNAKSIMGMMSLGLSSGEKVNVVAEGADESEAIVSIEQYLTATAV